MCVSVFQGSLLVIVIMIDGSEKRNRQLAFELQNSHVCEKRSNTIFKMKFYVAAIVTAFGYT